MRVLHVTQPNEQGVSRVVAALVDDQIRRGLDVAVACPVAGLLPGDVGPLAGEVVAAGARHVLWPARRSPGVNMVGEIARLARILRAERPELVHLHASKAGLGGRLVLRGRLPTVFQPHSWSFESEAGLVRAATVRWERAAARWTDAVVCVSDAERRRGEGAGIRAPFHVVPNGVDVEHFSAAGEQARNDARQRLGLAEGRLVVCIGRLSRQKGQDVLVDAWRRIAREVPDARLVLVGSGPEESALRAKAAADVMFAGEQADVRDWLAAADVVAVPSRWEGMSLSLLEAMARARSTVATDVGGAREALGDDAGALVRVEDEDALATALARRLLDPAVRAVEGKAARERVERLHDARAASARVAALYEQVLTARAAAAQ